LQTGQVSQVRGFADQRPRIKGNAADPANRRISLIVQYLDKTPPDEAGDKTPGAGDGAAGNSAESKNGGAEKK
jgi:hypothetical protein